MSKHDLEDRLIRFAVSVMQMAEQLPNSKTGIQVKGRIVKFSSAASLHYSEAQHAGSRKNFIRKLKVVLKALRETDANLKLADAQQEAPVPDLVPALLKEANELIAIFVVSIQTATRNEAMDRRIRKTRTELNA
jgi:four helix bundle protein